MKRKYYRLRFVPHQWHGPKGVYGYGPEGHFWVITPVMTRRMILKLRHAISWFSKYIWFMEVQIYRKCKWETIESWWEAPDGIQRPPDSKCDDQEAEPLVIKIEKLL